ncbi:hypothetical protein GDO78_022353 [Eleutherodactylus coqui]|uniref:RanBP2-type domain-containing protein n=1 Tax=Eleutherodactylus coqui TaxID=57060 RepID=A0A8J6B9J9_ELECQ|nr:hypothetical protein GDO78_022353 [Eleutherodactylus coqui]
MEATKGCKQMLKKLGRGEYGTLDEHEWQNFLTNFKGWLQDHGKYDQATMWYEVAQGITLTEHKARDTDKGTEYYVWEKIQLPTKAPITLSRVKTKSPTAPPPYNTPEGWTCPKCGQQNPDWREFCVACGGPRPPPPANLYPLVSKIHVHQGRGDIEHHAYEQYRPWTPAELLAMCNTLPDPRTVPSTFLRKLDSVQTAYKATWADLGSLLETKGREVLKNQILAKAPGNVPRDKTTKGSGEEFIEAIEPWVKEQQDIQTDNFMTQAQETKQTVADYATALEQLWLDYGYEVGDSKDF